MEFVRSHFLVREGVRFNRQKNSNPILHIDRIDKTASRWKKADVLVFNTGHWWTHGKTARGYGLIDWPLAVPFSSPPRRSRASAYPLILEQCSQEELLQRRRHAVPPIRLDGGLQESAQDMGSLDRQEHGPDGKRRLLPRILHCPFQVRDPRPANSADEEAGAGALRE